MSESSGKTSKAAKTRKSASKKEAPEKIEAPAAAKKAATAKTNARQTAPRKPAAKPSKAAAPAKQASKTKASGTVRQITEEKRQRMISEAAYHIAEKRQFAPGDEMEDWLQAEAQIDAGLKQTDASA